MSEPTLGDISLQLRQIAERLDELTSNVEILKQESKDIKQAVYKLDSRLFELSMRIVTANSSAFFGVGIALLSAAIAFVVARSSGGSL